MILLLLENVLHFKWTLNDKKITKYAILKGLIFSLVWRFVKLCQVILNQIQFFCFDMQLYDFN